MPLDKLQTAFCPAAMAGDVAATDIVLNKVHGGCTIMGFDTIVDDLAGPPPYWPMLTLDDPCSVSAPATPRQSARHLTGLRPSPTRSTVRASSPTDLRSGVADRRHSLRR